MSAVERVAVLATLRSASDAVREEREARLAAEFAALPVTWFAVSYALNGWESVEFVEARDIGDAVVVFRAKFAWINGTRDLVIVGVRVAGGNGGAR